MDFSSKLGEQLNSLDIDIAMAKSYLDKIFILYNLNSRQNAHNDNYIDCFLSKCSDIEKKDYSRNNLQAIKFNNINLECTIDDIIQDQNKKREKIFNIFKVERKSTFENNLILNRNRLLNSNPTHRLSRSKKIVTKDLPMSDHSKTNFKTSSNNINDSNIPLNPSKITDNIEEANNEFLKKNDRNSRLRLKKNTDNSLVDFTGLDQVEIKTNNIKIGKKRERSKTYRKNQGPSSKFLYRPDCIRKRIKALLHNYIFNKLSKILGKTNSKTLFLFKLPRDFVIDVKRENNKRMFLMTVKDLYSKYPNSKKDFSKVSHNSQIMTEIEDQEFQDEIGKPLYIHYQEYLSSSIFANDCFQLSNRVSLKMKQEYIYYSKSFLKFCFEA